MQQVARYAGQGISVGPRRPWRKKRAEDLRKHGGNNIPDTGEPKACKGAEPRQGQGQTGQGKKEGSRTADQRQEQAGGGSDNRETEHEGWMDMEGGWTWDMGWIELETTREGHTTTGWHRENMEERQYKEEMNGEEQNKDEEKNGNKKESKSGDTNRDNKIAKGCRKPATTNRTGGKKEGIKDDHQQNKTKHHEGPYAAPGLW